MQHLNIKLKDGAAYDAVLRTANVMPESGDMSIITKEDATFSGKSAVMVTFTCQLPNGEKATAQAVTTLALFLQTAAALRAAHEEELNS